VCIRRGRVAARRCRCVEMRTQQADELVHARNGVANFVPSRIHQAGHDLPGRCGSSPSRNGTRR
jgi:hypothetical protein